MFMQFNSTSGHDDENMFLIIHINIYFLYFMFSLNKLLLLTMKKFYLLENLFGQPQSLFTPRHLHLKIQIHFLRRGKQAGRRGLNACQGLVRRPSLKPFGWLRALFLNRGSTDPWGCTS
jgi:hypothetical protein